jgi:hypothetical protein
LASVAFKMTVAVVGWHRCIRDLEFTISPSPVPLT